MEKQADMRADRLLTLLMLLQSRGRLTARQLADELEVSERTIYRDIDALGLAGIPVYAERGPNGGCALLDSYRTTLTGLTEDETRALFMLSIPAPLTELGIGQELKAVLLKLSAALPERQRQHEVQVRQRLHLDPVAWTQSPDLAPHLHTVYRAVWTDRRITLTYRLPWEAQAERTVEPYALVAKANVWVLVYCWEGSMRTMRVSQILDACLTDEPFERNSDFDLAAYWTDWCTTYKQNRPFYPVTVRIAPTLLPYLRHVMGAPTLNITGETGVLDSEGWITVQLSFDTLESARTQLLGVGRAVEVLEPLPLRETLIDFARQIVRFYDAKAQGMT